MGKNFFGDRASSRIANAVRWVEQQRRDLTQILHRAKRIPHDICRFEMTDALALPQNGPGVAEAIRTRWDPQFSHAGLDFDDFLDQDALDWYGDYTDDFYGVGPKKMLVTGPETITVVDGMRNHSKMATVTGDVGAYGLAWKPHDGPVATKGGDKAVWEILTMQTPGLVYATADATMEITGPSLRVTAFDLAGTAGGHMTLSGYDPFGPAWIAANGGAKITAYNPPDGNGAYWFHVTEGECVLLHWNMRDNRYEILTVIGHIEANGFDAGDNPIVVRPLRQLDFDGDDFITTQPITGRAHIALRPPE